MSSGELHAEFISGRSGRLFVLARIPRPGCRAVIFVPPFAEEMNKTRHLFAQVATQLAARDVGSVWFDPFGTGDSAGEFAQADWDTWVDDMAVVNHWAAQKGAHIDRLLGVRLGCALAAQAVRRHGWSVRSTVFWQPVGSGARALDQFLRLRVAATLMQKDGKETVAGLRELLKQSATVEVAGYDLSGTLADQLERVDLAGDVTTELGSIAWIEIVRSAGAAPSIPSTKIVEGARDRGVTIHLETVPGEPFWASVEIVQNPQLIAQTVDVLGVAA